MATAHGVGLVVTPSGDVPNPNPVYNQAGNAMLGPVRAMIAAAVAGGTAADAAAAGRIGALAAGKLVTTFGRVADSRRRCCRRARTSRPASPLWMVRGRRR